MTTGNSPRVIRRGGSVWLSHLGIAGLPGLAVPDGRQASGGGLLVRLGLARNSLALFSLGPIDGTPAWRLDHAAADRKPLRAEWCRDLNGDGGAGINAVGQVGRQKFLAANSQRRR